jgi:uncharacterized membrane protein YraQ (UPF0718 family)
VDLLIASLLALLVAPLLDRAMRNRPTAPAALDGFVVVAISGVVLMHILPHAIEGAGWIALVAGIVGLVIPTLLHRVSERRSHVIVVALVLVGLGGHAFLDGVGLAEHGLASDRIIAWAVVLHRVPDGLAIWWLVRPKRGFAAATCLLLAIAAATVAGFHEGARVLDAANPTIMGLFQAAIGGSLLHVVLLHAPHGEGLRSRAATTASVMGAIVAIGLLYVLGLAHPHEEAGAPGELGAGTTFRLLALDSAPPLLLAFVAAGLVQSFLGHTSLAWLGRGSTLTQALRGIAFGVPLPLCSCGVVPVYQSVIARGASAAAALAFLVSAPEIGLDSTLLSVPLLGGSIAVARIACAALIALVTGVAVSQLAHVVAKPRSLPLAVGSTPSIRERLFDGLRLGLGEIVDHNLPWIVVGLVVGAVVEPTFRAHAIAGLPRGLDVPVLALLGVPSYVCAAGATPLMAVLRHKGLSAGAAIAFLLTGPATNLTTLGMLSRIHGRRVAVAFALVVGGSAIGLGYAVNAVLPDAPAMPLHTAAAEAPGRLAEVCLLILAALGVVSLFRQGVRGFLAQVIGGENGHRGHDHGVPPAEPVAAPVPPEARSPEVSTDADVEAEEDAAGAGV